MNRLIKLILVITVALSVEIGASSAQAVTTEEVKLQTPAGLIYGTLVIPPSKGRCPVVLIIAGSGPTDRNGNSPTLPGPNDSYKMLAQALAESGVASLRFDKRGAGASRAALKAEVDLRFDDYVDDVRGWVKQLRADRRFSTVTIVGHSEGSLIGMLAAQNGGADKYISIAGVGRPANLLLHDQLKPQFPEPVMKQIADDLSSLAAGKTVTTYPEQLGSLFHPSVQPYLISWFHYDPAKEITKLKIPVLILQGTSDVQVSVDDARMLAKADPHARFVLINGMNHVLKDVGTDPALQSRAYTDPSMPLDKTLVTEMIKTISGRNK